MNFAVKANVSKIVQIPNAKKALIVRMDDAIPTHALGFLAKAMLSVIKERVPKILAKKCRALKVKYVCGMNARMILVPAPIAPPI